LKVALNTINLNQTICYCLSSSSCNDRQEFLQIIRWKLRGSVYIIDVFVSFVALCHRSIHREWWSKWKKYINVKHLNDQR
jgi:hypothetical protein